MTISQPDSAENSVKIDTDPPSLIMEADVECSEDSMLKDPSDTDAEYEYIEEDEEEEYIPQNSKSRQTTIPNGIYHINEYLQPNNVSHTCILI